MRDIPDAYIAASIVAHCHGPACYRIARDGIVSEWRLNEMTARRLGDAWFDIIRLSALLIAKRLWKAVRPW